MNVFALIVAVIGVWEEEVRNASWRLGLQEPRMWWAEIYDRNGELVERKEVDSGVRMSPLRSKYGKQSNLVGS